MQNIKYVGSSDFRQISSEDLDSLDTKGDALEFHSGETKEVSNELGKVLLENGSFLGEFEEITPSDAKADAKAEKEAAIAEAKAKAEVEANKSQTGS